LNSPLGSDRGPTRFIVIVAVATAVLSVGPPLFGKGAFHPGDVVLQAAPWRSDTPSGFHAQNRLLTDITDGATPARTEIHRHVLDGSYPLWNPYSAGGVPLGTQPQNGLLSPLHLPYLLLPPWYAPAVAKTLQLLVALGFTFLFLRRLGLRRPSALVGGLIYMNSAFMVVWSGLPHAEVAALIPALFWSVDRAVALRTFRAALPVALVLAVMLLHGFPAVVAYAALAVAAYGLLRMAGRRGSGAKEHVSTFGRLAAAVVLGVGLAAVQLLPFATSLNEFDRSYRAQTSADVVPVRSLATLAVPGAFGRLGDTGYTTMSPVEAQSFAGASTLVLMLGALLPMPGRITRRVRGFLWAGVVLMVVLIYVGGPLLGAVQSILPSIFGQNSIGRLHSVLGFFFAGLAALGFEAFISSDRPPMSRGRRAAWISVWALTVAGAVLALRWLLDFARDAGQYSFVVRQLWLPVAVAAVTVAAVVVGWKRRPGGYHPLLLVAPLAFAVESVVFATGYLPTIDRSEFYPVTSTHRYLAAHIGHERMAAEGPTMWPGTQTYYHLRTVASHAFHPKPWLELLRAAGIAGGYETQPQLSRSLTTATSPIFDRLGVRFWVTRPELLPNGTRMRISSGASAVTLAPGRPVEHPTSLRRIRAVIVTLAEPFATTEDRVFIRAELLGRDGAVLGRGERRIDARHGAGEFAVPVAEYVGSTEPRSIRIGIRSRGASMRLVANGNDPALAVVVAGNDGLRLDFADGTLVYRRLSALDRIRWAGRAIVAEDSEQRISSLSRRLDPDVVLLDAPGPAGSGKPATLSILQDSGQGLRVRVRAQGSGYLVVADSIQDGWRARIDGRPAGIVAADHAAGAVAVPEGDHLISLDYRPPAWRIGWIVSLLSFLVLCGVLVIRRGSRTAADDAAGAADEPLGLDAGQPGKV
jgi:hypothetical protein